ncbi:SH2 domain-containing adapter protein E [Gadus morhua]|uniref:Src homology 2 domain containing E n=1 Tax=Gadus morhua TaxID=8049 RepID=A0A8C5ANB0_GADMO|nr:SH2 domain-containing adapter protein E [Gadus morhua]
MAKWFKEFPSNLKNGADRTRSESRGKLGMVESIGTKAVSSKGQSKNSSVDSGGGGVGSLLSGRNRKNSAPDQGKTEKNSSPKEAKVWDSLLPGKSRKNSKTECVAEEQQQRTSKSCSSANAYINRLIRVDKQDKTPNFNSAAITPPVVDQTQREKPQSPNKTETVVILEDYADPFDAQKKREAERAGENDGYMEPYDAQQMITEIRRRGSKDLLKVCVLSDLEEAPVEEVPPASPQQIYDVPYEGGSGDGGGGVGEGFSGEGQKSPVTWLEPDPRPPAEYELPWEWKKEQIVKTLSAQFDSAGRPLLAREEPRQHTLTRHPQHPPAPLPLQHHAKQKSWTQKILRSTPTLSTPSPTPASCSPDTESCAVVPGLPLEKQSWYHGCVSRQEAEFELQPCKEASFLVRNSESGTSKYSIALKTSQGCVHIIVAQTKESGYTLDQSRCVFPSIPEVVHHYSTRQLPFNDAEHMSLLHPVPRAH